MINWLLFLYSFYHANVCFNFLNRIFFFLLTSALNVITFSLASWGLAVGEQNKKQARETIPGAELHIQNALNVGGAVCAASGK